MVDDNTILEVINCNDLDMYKVCNDLVLLAKENGGRDNITVVGINLDKEVLE
jgi:serine/threonine protein phosphatase PrpC